MKCICVLFSWLMNGMFLFVITAALLTPGWCLFSFVVLMLCRLSTRRVRGDASCLRNTWMSWMVHWSPSSTAGAPVSLTRQWTWSSSSTSHTTFEHRLGQRPLMAGMMAVLHIGSPAETLSWAEHLQGMQSRKCPQQLLLLTVEHDCQEWQSCNLSALGAVCWYLWI